MSDWTRDLIYGAVIYAVLAGLAVGAMIALRMTMSRQRWLPLDRLRPGAWTGREVFFAFCIAQGMPLIIVGTLLRVGFFGVVLGPAPDMEGASADWRIYMLRGLSVSSPLVLTLTLGMIFAVLFALSGTRPHQYGFSGGRWQANLVLGLLAYIIATPIVLGVHAPITLLYPERPHPLVQVGKHELYAWEWAFLAFQALVASPLMEEIAFRGILQGWLRRATFNGHLTVCVMTIAAAVSGFSGPDAEPTDYVAPIVFALVLAGSYGLLMHRLARRFHLTGEERILWRLLPAPESLASTSSASEDEARVWRMQAHAHSETRLREWADANAYLSILGSAMLFASFHAANWPAPLPLVLLGLVLGWLARRTQSLIAPITLHALFNLVALATLFTSTQSAN